MPKSCPDTAEEFAARVRQIKGWKSGDIRAPHKPLLLLLALAEAQRGRRWIPFELVDEKLRELLEQFGPPRDAVHCEYPFWRLQNDGLWEVPSSTPLKPNRAGDVSRRALLDSRAQGGFSERDYTTLQRCPGAIDLAARTLLDDNFPPSMHEDILDAVGLEWRIELRARRRDPRFRELVLTAYNRRCAICGFDGRIKGTEFAVDAAHVRWHARSGVDEVRNGVALCALHHKALDRGVISFTVDHRVLVSELLSGDPASLQLWLLRFRNSKLAAPLHGGPTVAVDNIRWHQREVFLVPHESRAGGA